MVQVRYGWTDQVIHGLLFTRFTQLAQLSADARKEEARERLVLAAFIGFQLGAANKNTFREYLNELGLYDELPQSITPVFDREAVDAKLKGRGIVPKKVDNI